MFIIPKIAYLCRTLDSFIDLGLNKALLEGIAELGFTEPTPVQTKTIPLLLANNTDVIALAQTGTGKTAAFGLPILQLIDSGAQYTQCLVVCPTRELCVQISRDLEQYGKFIPDVKIVAVYGGASIQPQIQQLRRGAHIIVATPGRLMDLMERKAIKLNNVRFAILDEADEMLNMGFREDMEYILQYTPKEKITCLFSATMPHEVKDIASKFLTNPIEVSVARANAGASNLTHEYAVVHAKDKYAALKRIIDFNTDFYGIVFCQTKIETQEISDRLVRDGYIADCLHGDLSQAQREKTLNKFRHRAIQVMLATDVAARGIDVSDLTHVIHYLLPEDFEVYTHRSGRTARAGKSGVSYTLLNIKEAHKLRQIEKKTGISFARVTIPTALEVRDKKLMSAVNRIIQLEVDETLFDHEVKEAISQLEQLEKGDLIKKIMSFELQRFSEEYLNSPDLNAKDKIDTGLHTRLFVSLGKKDGFDTQGMKEFVSHFAGLDMAHILFVDVSGVYSFVKVDEKHAAQIINAMNGGTYKGRPIRIEMTEGPKPHRGSRPEYGDRNRRSGRPEGGGGRRYEGGGGSGGGRGRSDRDGGGSGGGFRDKKYGENKKFR